MPGLGTASYVLLMLAQAQSDDRDRALAACAGLSTRPLQIAAWIHEGGLDLARAPSALFLESEGGLALVSELGVVMPHLVREPSIDELARIVGPVAPRVIVGPAWVARRLWDLLERRGSRARVARDQVGYIVSRDSFRGLLEAREVELRPAGLEDLDALVAASAAMAIEESNDDPARRNPGLFRARIAERIRKGRDFVLCEHGQLVFKVNIAALSPQGGHIEGVYTIPAARGRGIGRAGTAWATRWILERGPLATLLVNHDNWCARSLYEALGYVRAYESRTILAR